VRFETRFGNVFSLNVRAVALLAVILSGTSIVVAAEPGTMVPAQASQQIIASQQLQIDKLQNELSAQSETLQRLVQQVEKLTAEAGDVTVTDMTVTSAVPPAAVPATPVAESRQAEPRQVEPDWPGSFGLFGTDTRLAIGGYVQLDVIHDSDAIGTPCEFVTSTIPTDGGTMVEGAGGQTSFCINTSRLTLESRTPLRSGQLKTFVSMDLYGDSHSTSPDPRLRQAYAELSGALWGGDLLLGQAWSTYVNLEAWPDILDFEGPGSAVSVRQPMVRWSKRLSDKMDFQLALEQPGDGAVLGADMLTGWPDLVTTLKWRLDGGGHLKGAGIVRDLRVSANDSPSESTIGWGVAGSGKLVLPGRNNMVFEASYGKGAGAYYNDGPLNGVYDPVSSKIILLPLFAYYVGFEHEWSDSLSSAVLYSAIDVDNRDYLPASAGQKSKYFSLNLIWHPDTRQMYGIEFLSGARRDQGGAEGTDNRIQLTGHYSFH
jgi:hypothetical protein